jgi:hypothetical protein
MHAGPGHTLSILVIAGVAVLFALGLTLAIEPGGEPAILLIGGVTCLILYGLMYGVQRRRHW